MTETPPARVSHHRPKSNMRHAQLSGKSICLVASPIYICASAKNGCQPSRSFKWETLAKCSTLAQLGCWQCRSATTETGTTSDTIVKGIQRLRTSIAKMSQPDGVTTRNCAPTGSVTPFPRVPHTALFDFHLTSCTIPTRGWSAQPTHTHLLHCDGTLGCQSYVPACSSL